MNEEREKVYQILELGKHEKNLHHKKGFGGLLFIDLSMIKFSKLSSYIRQLDKENQELKEKLDKYENPEDMTLFAMWCTEKVKEENQKLKKQLEAYEIEGYEQNEELNKMSFDIRKYKLQQKEFIKYLEDEIERLKENDIYQPLQRTALITHEHDLQKYKEIIGVSDEIN